MTMEEYHYKITQKDLAVITAIQKKIDALYTKYEEKYGVDEYDCNISLVADQLSVASAALEEIREKENTYNI